MFRRMPLAIAALVALAVPTGALGAPTTYFRNLNSNTVKPSVLFFAANNGARMLDIQWHGWGSRRAVGYGGWMARAIGTVGEDELDVRPGRVILTDPKVCGGKRFYLGFKLITWDSGYHKVVTGYHDRC
jgi:hypothetical protein